MRRSLGWLPIVAAVGCVLGLGAGFTLAQNPVEQVAFENDEPFLVEMREGASKVKPSDLRNETAAAGRVVESLWCQFASEDESNIFFCYDNSGGRGVPVLVHREPQDMMRSREYSVMAEDMLTARFITVAQVPDDASSDFVLATLRRTGAYTALRTHPFSAKPDKCADVVTCAAAVKDKCMEFGSEVESASFEKGRHCGGMCRNFAVVTFECTVYEEGGAPRMIPVLVGF
ncbi:MAG: hypothetical protein HC882_03690 [Acidobacteria bacterium]|nr:hypothetical protein [Acidobacteriota bacterium]